MNKLILVEKMYKKAKTTNGQATNGQATNGLTINGKDKRITSRSN
jgi:hypothetical protein